MVTFNDVVELMKVQDEVTVCELLSLTSDDLVYAFMDRIEERQEFLREELTE